MKNCEKRQGELALEAILKELDETLIRKAIDEPIEKAFEVFLQKLDGLAELPGIEELLARLVETLYRDALHAPWKAGDPEATSLAFLENHYRGIQGQGYYAALVDAIESGSDGLQYVLFQLAQIIRANERQEYTNAVIVRRLNPCDWHLRCQVVEVIIERYRPLLPPLLLECAVWQLVDDIPAMIQNISAVLPVCQPLPRACS